MEKYLAAIDVGTTGAKAIITDLQGNIVGKGYQEYPCSYPEDQWVEQKASDLINGAFKACKDAVESSEVDPCQIKAVSFSAQRATFGFMYESGSIIDDCLYVWQDNRASSIMDEITSKIDPYEFYKIQGQPVTPTFSFEKIMWIKKHKKEALEKARQFFLVVDLVAYLFGAEKIFAERANACSSSMFDLKEEKWSKRIIDLFEIDEKILPEVVKAGDVIGKVTMEASDKSGLAEGTIVVAGSGDNQCGALGAGVVKEGQASMSLGTSGVLVVGSEEPLLKEDMGLMVANALAPGLFELEAIQLGAASSYRWIKDALCQKEVEEGKKKGEDPFVLMEEHVKESPAGANGLVFSPYLMGAGYPYWNVESKGSFVGITFSTTRSDMIRSVMEGITMESKDMYETLHESGINIDILTIIGGATKSPTWCQMIADMFKVKVRRLKNEDATLTGAAILAGVGCGAYESIEEGVDQLVKYDNEIVPQEENMKIYDERYKEFKKIYKSLYDSEIQYV